MGDTQIIVEPGRQDVVFKKVFDAPRDIVFRALTDPDLVSRYWGPAEYETVVDVMEPREGGRWRFVQRGPEGEFAFRGVYHSVTPERIVQTNEFEGMPGPPALEWAELEERDGKTYYTAVSLAPSVEARDAVVASGMEWGARQLYERLEALVESLKAPV